MRSRLSAKCQLLSAAVRTSSNSEKVVREKMAYEFYHYPLDFLERYRSEVEKVTADDVARVAHQSLLVSGVFIVYWRVAKLDSAPYVQSPA
jgi:zinc protease